MNKATWFALPGGSNYKIAETNRHLALYAGQGAFWFPLTVRLICSNLSGDERRLCIESINYFKGREKFLP